MADMVALKLILVFDGELSAEKWRQQTELRSEKIGGRWRCLDMGCRRWLDAADRIHRDANVVSLCGEVRWSFDPSDLFELVEKAEGLATAEVHYCAFEIEQLGALYWDSLTDIVTEKWVPHDKWPEQPDEVAESDDDAVYEAWCERREEEAERVLEECPAVEKWTRERARKDREDTDLLIKAGAQALAEFLRQRKEQTMT